MLNKLFKIPKQLLNSYNRLPQIQKMVVLAVAALAGWWLWKNYLVKVERFNSASPGTLSCTMYMTEWCPHCVSAKPHWAKISDMFNGKTVNGKKILITSVDCEKFPEIAKQQNIGGYPTFKFNLDGKDILYDGERNYNAFKGYIEKIVHSDYQ